MEYMDHRNKIVFKKGQVDSEEMLHMAQLKIWLWLKYKMKSFLYSFSEWVMDLIQCIKNCI